MAMNFFGQYDVAVVGSGPAGICAAVSAARAGSKVVLIEKSSVLGGNLTDVVLVILGFHTNDGKQIVKGIGQEIVDRLVSIGASPGHVVSLFGQTSRLVPYDPVAMRTLLMEMISENEIDLLLNATVSDVIMEGQSVTGIVARSISTEMLVRATVVVDCSGDGDVAALAGADYSVGRDSDGVTQPLGHSIIVGNVDVEALRSFLKRHPHHVRLGSFEDGQISIAGFSEIIKQVGDYPGRDEIDLFSLPMPGTVLLNTTRIRDLNPLSVRDLSRAELVGAQQISGVHKFIKENIPGFEHSFITFASTRAGIRESRHIQGLYCLTAEDCVSGRRFDDSIAKGAYPIDIHDPDSGTVTLVHIEGDGCYDIPYRCLVPQGVENLLVAGRPISATHEAHGSVRVMATCMATGQAAGAAAAKAAQQGITPSLVDPNELRQFLLDQNCIV